MNNKKCQFHKQFIKAAATTVKGRWRKTKSQEHVHCCWTLVRCGQAAVTAPASSPSSSCVGAAAASQYLFINTTWASESEVAHIVGVGHDIHEGRENNVIRSAACNDVLSVRAGPDIPEVERGGQLVQSRSEEETCEKCASLNRAIINFSLAPYCCQIVCLGPKKDREGHIQCHKDEMRQSVSARSIDSSATCSHIVRLQRRTGV